MRIKRVVASFGASFDQFITKMENHEAVAKCVIDDVRQSAAKVRGEKLRVERRLRSVGNEISTLEKNKALWKERAMSCLDSDEEKAKACMKQVAIAEKQWSQMQSLRQQLESVAKKLTSHLRDIEHKIEDLESRRLVLSSRQAKANVVSRLDEDQTINGGEALFDRWEEQIIHREYSDVDMLSDDVSELGLAKEFETQEEDEKLALALSLLREEKEAAGEKRAQEEKQSLSVGEYNQGVSRGQ